MSDLTKAWFDKAKELEPEQSIMLQVMSKIDMTALAREFQDEKEEYAKVNAAHAAQFVILKTYKDGRMWIVIRREVCAPLVGFFKDVDGKLTKIRIDPVRQRRLSLMLRDGLPRKDIEENMNGLTEEEIEKFFPNEKL